MKKILTVFALEDETQNLFTNANVLYTGVGKVNASYALTKAIFQNRPDVIINLGTVGSKNFNYGEMVLCEKFIQRDMNATVFGYENFVTPSDSTPQVLEIPSFVSQLFKNSGTCGTGDSFETKITGDELYNVVDMEAFALAKIAFLEKIPFICVKFVSDGANDKAPSLWSESLQIGAERMRESYNLIVQNLQ